MDVNQFSSINTGAPGSRDRIFQQESEDLPIGQTSISTLLLENIKILHKKFQAENPFITLSYATFAKLRPFYVVIPTEKDRDTCLCHVDENLRLMLSKLSSLKVVDAAMQSITDIPAFLTCKLSKTCMYRECDVCMDKEITFNVENVDVNEEVEYWQWGQVKESRQRINTKDGSIHKYEVTRTAKQNVSIQMYDLMCKFSTACAKFCKHFYNIYHQYKHFKMLTSSLKADEAIIHIDFSENYTLRYSHHVQSAHFGASMQQATLHTGVIYGLEKEPTCFCTISPNLNHGPPAIWCHLTPVLEFMALKYGNIKHLHFYSDSPSSQYRQKGNFYLLCKVPFEMGFASSTWNFWEAGHGRGAPDGVGGALKRTADRIVRNGTDIPDPETLFQKLIENETTIKLFYVESEVIDESYKNIPNLKPVPKTMTIHQVVSKELGKMHSREVSCYCSIDRDCTCFDLQNAENIFPQITTDGEILSNHQAETIVSSSGSLINILEVYTPEVIGNWVVVTYNGSLYPGKIQEYDEIQVWVNCMSRSGRTPNKFFWPKIEDSMGYRYEDVATHMEEPNILPSGHVEIPIVLWNELTTIKKNK